MSTIAIIPIPGVPQIKPGDDLPAIRLKAIDDAKVGLKDGDILVLCQKIVSKAEGAVVDLRTVTPSPFARQIADMWEKDPRMVEVVLTESSRIVRMKNGVVITESKHGWVCANSGVDASNTIADDVVILLPKDPDASARHLRLTVERQRHIAIGVIITDTFALGVSGLDPLDDQRGEEDLQGRELHHTVIAVADELAAAAGLLMEKSAAMPAVLIRGYRFKPADVGSESLKRPADADLFR